MADEPPKRTARGAPREEGSWCWQSKEARRQIRKRLDGTEEICSALSTYDALCEIASDEASPTFETTHAWIGVLSGLSPATVKRRLPCLVEFGLLSVKEQPAMRGPCTYTLLSIAHNDTTIAHGEPTIAHGGNGAPRATSEEGKKKEGRKREGEEEVEGGASAPASHSMSTPDLGLASEVAHSTPFWSKDGSWKGITPEDKARWKIAYPACDVERQLAQMEEWLRANPSESRKSNWNRFITNWLKREQDKGGDVRADRRTAAQTATPANGANRYQQKAPTAEDHGKGFFHGLDGDWQQPAHLKESLNHGAQVSADATYEAIYDAYPRKQARQEALKAIAKAIESKSADYLLARTRAYAAAAARWNDNDRQFIPHPATWFNRGSYDDDPKTWERNYANPRQEKAPSAADHGKGWDHPDNQ